MSKKLLIVEDNEMNLKLINAVLKRRPYQLSDARDGEDALKLVASERPDIILMDIQIPKIDGLEVTRAVRKMENGDKTLVIALTAHAMEGDREKILAAGCDGYIVKPLNTRTLADEIEAIWAANRGQGDENEKQD